jgi:hypothetical protein
MNFELQHMRLPDVITAIGGLGTAAFGLLEAIKPVIPWINRMGFPEIRTTITTLTPSEPGAHPPVNALPRAKILDTLLANWVNGNDVASQKAIAKTLIKMHLSAGNAAAVAAATNVDPALLAGAAASIAASAALDQQQTDAYSRFDLIVTAMLDEVYQCADQVYRNWTRAWAAAIAVALSLVGGYVLQGAYQSFSDFGIALLIGLLATPLAPIAKDLTTALATAVNTLQLVKK